MRTPLIAALCLLPLAACDNAKTRNPPPAETPAAAAPAAPVAPAAGPLSEGLTKRTEMAGFYLDHVGQAQDPVGKQPATTSAATPIALDGFGYDPVAKAPAKGVDVVIDGKAYGTTYGHQRQDVATYFKNPNLANVGFTTSLPVGTLAPGDHTAIVRVISADGTSYFDSPAIKFSVK